MGYRVIARVTAAVFALIVLVGVVRWPEPRDRFETTWQSSTTPVPPLFLYAFLPTGQDVRQYLGVERIVLVSQEELEAGSIGVYSDTGEYGLFPRSSFESLDADRCTHDLVLMAETVHRRRIAEKYAIDVKYDDAQVTLTLSGRDVSDRFVYQLAGPTHEVQAVSWSKCLRSVHAPHAFRQKMLFILAALLIWAVADWLIRRRTHTSTLSLRAAETTCV
jgi:hypothetical protein